MGSREIKLGLVWFVFLIYFKRPPWLSWLNSLISESGGGKMFLKFKNQSPSFYQKLVK